MAPIKCSYHNCTNNSVTKSIFRFPVKDETRLKLWLENSGNPKLLSMRLDELKNRFVCEDHFDAGYVHKSALRSRLACKYAVPRSYKPVTSPERNTNLPLFTDEELYDRYLCVGHSHPTCIYASEMRLRLLESARPGNRKLNDSDGSSHLETSVLSLPESEELKVTAPTKFYKRNKTPAKADYKRSSSKVIFDLASLSTLTKHTLSPYTSEHRAYSEGENGNQSSTWKTLGKVTADPDPPEKQEYTLFEDTDIAIKFENEYDPLIDVEDTHLEDLHLNLDVEQQTCNKIKFEEVDSQSSSGKNLGEEDEESISAGGESLFKGWLKKLTLKADLVNAAEGKIEDAKTAVTEINSLTTKNSEETGTHNVQSDNGTKLLECDICVKRFTRLIQGGIF